MKHALARAASALSIALASSAASATVPDVPANLPEWVASGDIIQQRKDVDEVSRPQPPSGPTTVPCGPSSPICP